MSPTSLDILLAEAASSVFHPTAPQQEILERLSRLRARLDEGLLRVAVLGQFKRGKSTLLNALLGAPLLPTGITPVTAIPTFIKAGAETNARITFTDGKEPLLISAVAEIPDILQRYISETENPRNRLKVETVELEVRSQFLDQGIVLVDTPGVGSTFLHNTKAAEAVLAECDAAVFVISADPPITEVEIDYLRKVKELIPKIFFALNKIDLLDAREKGVAERFLSDVLAQQSALAQPVRIFSVSAKQGLKAKQDGDARALAGSGVEHLEQVLAGELAHERRAIAFAIGRQRSISLIGELLFQSELEHKALLLPEENLKQKAVTFESSVASFEAESQALSDLLSLDRKHLVKDLETETDRLWNEAQKQARQLVGQITARSFELNEARQHVAAALSQYFEHAFRQSVELFREKLSQRLAIHQERAGALINLVRQTAADLMAISVSLPQSELAFEARREPYWTAPEPSVSLLDIPAGSLARFMPESIRKKRASGQLAADTEKAVLRNLANLDWAVRQNLEDAFRRFESSLDEQLGRALAATREAMHIAIERRTARAEEMEDYVKDSARSVACLSNILDELQSIKTNTPLP
jgi:GTP-binding protein EngB required for normal cell division